MGGTIYFIKPDLTIDTSGAPVWAAPAPPGRSLSLAERIENLVSIARSILAGPRLVDPSPLLPALLGSGGLDGEQPGSASRQTLAQHPDLAGLRGA
jgi:hypothetical protein